MLGIYFFFMKKHEELISNILFYTCTGNFLDIMPFILFLFFDVNVLSSQEIFHTVQINRNLASLEMLQFEKR